MTHSSPHIPFLSLVADDLYARYGNDLSRVAVVFPNKRAGLFFNDYLSACSETPIWAPTYITISELLLNQSARQKADPIRMVCDLYRIFRSETDSQESLDDFYFWGELLINDFDDLDKNLVDADKLFTNLKDLKNIMDVPDYLTPEQEEAIRLFFHNFSLEKRTELKEKFISLWEVLGNIYHRFQESLQKENLGYEGMIYRQVVEQWKLSSWEYDCYVFVGFNVLNRVEHRLFQLLKENEKALFYWDYDTFYTQNINHEAGEFIKRNLRDFPSPLNIEYFQNLNSPKNIRYVSATTENAQARYMAEWTAQCVVENERENAIILCNESLLLPVYHALSPQIKHVNITMGFPLSQTPIVSLLQTLLELQLHGYDTENGRFNLTQVLPVLSHSYTRLLSPQLSRALSQELQSELRLFPLPGELQKDEITTFLFTPQQNHLELIRYLMEVIRRIAQIYQERNEDMSEKKSPVFSQSHTENELFSQLYQEALFKAYITLQRIETLILDESLVVNGNTLCTLLSRLLLSLSIPFHGEPAIGVQVMGVLETRNLDFRRIAILSLGEGLLPKVSDTASFVPYNLRKAFGMTTPEHKNAVYAYYFYRLLQRAEDITLLYNNYTEGSNAREWSRFLLQFLVEWPHPIQRYTLNATPTLSLPKELCISKEGAVYQQMLNIYDTQKQPKAYLSASALNCYMDCPLKFYLKYIAGIRVHEEISSDIDAALFGSIFHRVAEELYKDLAIQGGGMITSEQIQKLLKSKTTLELLLDKVFNELLFHPHEGERPQYNGLQLIHRKVISRYIIRLLQHDCIYAPFKLEGSEIKIREPFLLNCTDGNTLSLCLGGTIDRMDSKEGILRIVDYKTGGIPQKTTNLESLFLPSEKRSGYIFQTFLYAFIMWHQEQKKGTLRSVLPCLMYIHKASSDEYSATIELGESRKKETVTDFSVYENDFRILLQQLLQEIFNPDIPFTQTEIISKCEYCDFKSLCKR